MQRVRRTIFLVDREVQGALMFRVAWYWLFCLLLVSLMLICWNAWHGPPRRFVDLAAELYFRYGPALAASLVLLPIVLIDVMRLSNRFVGPMLRLRQGLREVADGRPAQPLNFRDDDFWRELATDFNRASARLASADSLRIKPTEAMPEPLGHESD